MTKVAILRILAADNQSYFHGEQLNITFAQPANQRGPARRAVDR